MARKENEKVGIFNCHGMGGNQVRIFFVILMYQIIWNTYFSSEQFFNYFSSFPYNVLK